MQFERDDKTCKFEIPDHPTVRQQMIYMGKAAGNSDGMHILKFWTGAKDLITVWECEIFPDHKADLDSVSDSNITNILIWAGLQVWMYMLNLDELPKN